ncbi:ornithine carbamoyltransferase [Halanaerobium salsuginis]|uniref:Ornithine carbamoyltransferase n=1 Tax=Halanaerobium salsuginis TaxID=29563 RepID=A0A1I4MY10_9FIRM|nr:ornithine carbamoyltransferase [Halanaerobium salsuginis]SFM07977.1 ornithine carbamoyltransferase [Halanaerobium salsuginis]
MGLNLRGRSFLTLKDFSSAEIYYLLDLAADLKRKKRSGISGQLLKDKNIVLLFEKSSTRTRCSFEVAAYDEGANVTNLTNSQLGKKETVEDTARVLGRFYDGIEFRGFKQKDVETLAAESGVPVWNGLTDAYHPTQVLADLMTIRENTTKSLNSIKLVYAGDARNNMGNSLLIAAAKLGMEFVALAPKSLWPDPKLIAEMQQLAKKTQAKITLTEDLAEVKGADVIYTDVWVSMGEEDHFAERIELLKKYQVNQQLINSTQNKAVIFLHCLPSFHDNKTIIGSKIEQEFGIKEMEVTDTVFNGQHSRVFEEAENRMHTIKAVIVATLGS